MTSTQTKIFIMLLQAANMGQDFSSATADTIKYDSIEDMIKDNFGHCKHCDNIQQFGGDCNICGYPLYKI